MTRNRKAVSPIVATLLLILIAVAAAVVLYAWTSNLTSNTKNTGAENTGVAFKVEQARLIKNLTRLNVTDASGNNFTISNATAVKIFLRNIGSQPIDNGTWSLYILNPTTKEILLATSNWTFDKVLSPGEIESNVTAVIDGHVFERSNNTYIYLTNKTVAGEINAGDYYIIKIVSPQGLSDTIKVKAIEKETG